MIRHKSYCLALAAASFLLITLLSCNSNPDQIPFPEKELGYSQPVTVPLQFSEEKKLTWDTAKKGGVNPVIKKLDIDALPSSPYDSTGFQPFNKPPEEVNFDFSRLPDTAFSLESLPSKPLQFKTTILAPSAIIKVSPPSVQKGNPLSIFDFGSKQGLPAAFVTSLLQDKNGLMWIASREGLFRYDGENIQTFIPGPLAATINGLVEDDYGRIWGISSQGMGMIDPHKGTGSFTNMFKSPVNNLSRTIKDESGRIWISKTTDKAVIIIDPATQTFQRLDSSNGLKILDGIVTDILQDDDKNIWLATNRGGASIINQKANKIKYLTKTNGLSSDTLWALTKDNNEKVWVVRRPGSLDAIDTKEGKIRHYEPSTGFKLSFTTNMSCDNKGRIWIGTTGGVDVLNPLNGTNRLIDNTRGLAANWVASCTMDNNNRMWVATIGGLHIIDQNAETVNPFSATQIISLMEDPVGNIWVATQQGIKLINAKKTIVRRLDKSNGLGDNFVQGFTNFNQQMWVTTNGGLDIIDPVRKTIEHTGKKEGLVNDTIYAVMKDKAGNIWLTGPGNGINLIDASKQTILHTDVTCGLSNNNIVDAKEDNEGLIWLAVNIKGVNVFDPTTGKVKYLNNQPGLKDTCTKIMLVDQYGRIWIGTDKGLYVVDKKKATITSVTTREGLTSNRILSLLEYKGSVIAGTSKKVNIITAPAPDYTKGNTDTSGGVWKISILEKSEGLNREATTSWGTDAITKKGQYLWGDDLGIFVINDIKDDSNQVATYVTGITVMNKPQYFANKISLNEKDSLWASDTFYVKGQTPVNTGYTTAKGFTWDSVSAPFNMPLHLSIPYDNNYMQFHFAQAHLSRQDVTSYTYLLEGIDKNWSTVTTNTSTENYLNLPPGKYTFKVSSKGINGRWTKPATFSFTIAPPWYKTWWAYTLYALLFIGLLRAYIVYRSRRLQRENKVLEQKVTLRTTQLQQSLEDLKATQAQLIQSEKMASLGELTAGIAHEIQNPLNFINNFSEVNTELIAEMKEEIDKGNLDEVKNIADDIAANEQKINHHGKRADGIVKGMLQHSRTGNRQKEPTNINTLADEYLRLAYHGLRAKDKSFNATMKTDFDESIGNINVIPQDIGRVILNLITNAFYAASLPSKAGFSDSDKTQGPTIWVTTKKIGNKVEIRVRDNGPGIPQKILDKIFQPFFTTKPSGEGTGLGLSLSYDIVKAHGGELKVETKEGEFAEFIITLPV